MVIVIKTVIWHDQGSETVRLKDADTELSSKILRTL